MGQPIRAGTAFTQILLDETALTSFLQDTSLPSMEEGEEEEDAIDQTLVDEELYGTSNDACAQLEVQMNLVLPNPDANLAEEEEIELVEV
jgi:hypothetical protein